jgi:hypothetical protein
VYLDALVLELGESLLDLLAPESPREFDPDVDRGASDRPTMLKRKVRCLCLQPRWPHWGQAWALVSSPGKEALNFRE